MRAAVTEKVLRRRAASLGWATVLAAIPGNALAVFIGLRFLAAGSPSEVWAFVLLGGSAAASVIALVVVALSCFAVRGGHTARARTTATAGSALAWAILVGIVVAAAGLTWALGPTRDLLPMSVILNVATVGLAWVTRSFARSARANAFSTVE